jgi:hypothetical protein
MDPLLRQSQDGENGHQNGSEDQDHGLDGFSHDHRLEPAQDSVDSCYDRDDDDGGDHPDAEKLLEHRGAGIKTHPDVDEKGGQDGHERQEHPRRGTIALLQELGQGGDPALKIEGGENEPEQDQRKSGHPFEVPPDHALVVARGGQPNEVDGGYIGSEQSGTDHAPGQGPARQEVDLAGQLQPTDREDANGEYADEVGYDDDKVEGRNAELSSEHDFLRARLYKKKWGRSYLFHPLPHPPPAETVSQFGEGSYLNGTVPIYLGGVSAGGCGWGRGPGG